jgi:arylsulfatase A-like enzyme
VLVAFTSDHGVVGTPEAREAAGLPASRTDIDDLRCTDPALATITETLGRPNVLDNSGSHPWLLPGPLLEEALIRERGHDPAEVLERLATELDACPSIRRIWTRARLAEADLGERDARLFHNAFHPERSPDYLIQFEPHHLWTQTSAASHSSPYGYDTHVPFIVRGPGLGAQRIEAPIGMVDAAPTLAALIGIEAPADLDGVDRSDLFTD